MNTRVPGCSGDDRQLQSATRLLGMRRSWRLSVGEPSLRNPMVRHLLPISRNSSLCITHTTVSFAPVVFDG